MPSDVLSLHRELAGSLRAGRPAAAATIIRAEGSTPQTLGAKILLLAGGRTLGTVGGGSLEAEVCQRLGALLEYGAAEVRAFGLTEDDDGAMACGGRVTLLLETIKPSAISIYDALLACLETKEPAALLTALDGPAGAISSGARKALTLITGERVGESHPAFAADSVRPAVRTALTDGQPRFVELPPGPSPEHVAQLVFVEPFLSRPTLLIVGAGHVGQATSHLGKWLGFEVAVLDNRPDYVTPERLPDADMLIVDGFVPGLRGFPVTASTYIVLVTRGHDWDEACLRAAIDTPAAYVGMIGSRRRVGMVLNRLREDGVSEEQLARVHTPIGLDIGAVTVEEIAVSILAEIIANRRVGKKAKG